MTSKLALPNLQLRTDWQDKTSVPTALGALPDSHTTQLVNNRRDFLFTTSKSWGGVLYVLSLGAQPLARTLMTETIISCSSELVKRIETDIKRTNGGKQNDLSSQIETDRSVAQIWDSTLNSGKGGWVDAVTLSVPIHSAQTNLIRWKYRFLRDRSVYESVTVNSIEQPIDADFPLRDEPWKDDTLLQMQFAAAPASPQNTVTAVVSVSATAVIFGF